MLLFLNIFHLFFPISTVLFRYLTFFPCFWFCVVVSLVFSVCFHLWACVLVLLLYSFWFLSYFSFFLFSLHFVSVSVWVSLSVLVSLVLILLFALGFYLSFFC